MLTALVDFAKSNCVSSVTQAVMVGTVYTLHKLGLLKHILGHISTITSVIAKVLSTPVGESQNLVSFGLCVLVRVRGITHNSPSRARSHLRKLIEQPRRIRCIWHQRPRRLRSPPSLKTLLRRTVTHLRPSQLAPRVLLDAGLHVKIRVTEILLFTHSLQLKKQ